MKLVLSIGTPQSRLNYKQSTMENNKENKTPFLQLHSFNDAVFNINGQEKTMNVFELMKMTDMLKGHLKNLSRISWDLYFYDNYDDKRINEILDEDEKNWIGDEKEIYRIGGNYAEFMSMTSDRFYDNHKATKVLKREFKKLYPKNKLSFDPEMSHCYIYSKNREEAFNFLKFVYDKYIEPYLREWRVGWDKFKEDFAAAPEAEQQTFKFF